MNDARMVTTAKPKKGGAIFRAPLGTVLPKTIDDALDAAFECLGYISDDGLVNSNNMDTDKVKAWGGDTVLDMETGKSDAWKYTMIEAMNVNVLKSVYGDENVTEKVTEGTGGEKTHDITVKANSDEQKECSFVVDMLMKNGAAKRVVIPCAKVTSVGDVSYVDGEPVGYETTISATNDTDGQSHYEYIRYKTKG